MAIQNLSTLDLNSDRRSRMFGRMKANVSKKSRVGSAHKLFTTTAERISTVLIDDFVMLDDRYLHINRSILTTLNIHLTKSIMYWWAVPTLQFKNITMDITIPDILTLEEASGYLRLSIETVATQALKGNISGLKIENNWRFLKSAIDDWLRSKNSSSVLLAQAGALADDDSIDNQFTA